MSTLLKRTVYRITSTIMELTGWALGIIGALTPFGLAVAAAQAGLWPVAAMAIAIGLLIPVIALHVWSADHE